MTVHTAKPRLAAAAAIVLAAAMVPGAVPVPAAAQPAAAQGANPLVSDMMPEAAAEKIYVKIQAIDPQRREVALEAANGRTMTVIAAPQVPLDDLKVGDPANAHYYRSVAFLISKSMQVPTGQTAQLPPEQAQLLQRQTQAKIQGGMGVRMIQVSGLIVGIHPSAHTLDVVNPTGGGVYTIHAGDPSRDALIPSLKVGDTVTAVISPPIATSIERDRGPLADLAHVFRK